MKNNYPEPEDDGPTTYVKVPEDEFENLRANLLDFVKSRALFDAEFTAHIRRGKFMRPYYFTCAMFLGFLLAKWIYAP